MIDALTAGRGRIAGIELGGTKGIALLWQDGVVVARHRVDTTTPAATLGGLTAALGGWWAQAPFAALGIASFGPVALDPERADYGHILTTTKPGWSGTNVAPALAARFACPVAIDTDVNAAALAEYRWGAGQGARSLVYITLGTGVGGGLLVDGRPLHGRLHPEIGHIQLMRAKGDEFAGTCIFHGDCVEGLLSGPALHARFAAPAETVSANDPRWNIVVADLARFLQMLVNAYAPNRIIIGGGVGMGLADGNMLAYAKTALGDLLGGYYPDLDGAALDAMIVSPMLGNDAGPLGAIALGLDALERQALTSRTDP